MTSADLLIPVNHDAVTKGGTSNLNVPFTSLKLILPYEPLFIISSPMKSQVSGGNYVTRRILAKIRMKTIQGKERIFLSHMVTICNHLGSESRGVCGEREGMP